MFEKLLEKIALALDKNKISYMVLGGQAVLLYGEPRLTRDIDITLGLPAERVSLLLSAIQGTGLQPLADPDTFVAKTMVLPCEDPDTKIRIDFIFSFSPYEQAALERVRLVPVGRGRVKFASVEDLIIHKMIAGRPRDLEDVHSVVVRNPEMDLAYIRKWLRAFARSLKEPFAKRFSAILKRAAVKPKTRKGSNRDKGGRP
jgi:hypothetical protein